MRGALRSSRVVNRASQDNVRGHRRVFGKVSGRSAVFVVSGAIVQRGASVIRVEAMTREEGARVTLARYKVQP